MHKIAHRCELVVVDEHQTSRVYHGCEATAHQKRKISNHKCKNEVIQLGRQSHPFNKQTPICRGVVSFFEGGRFQRASLHRPPSLTQENRMDRYYCGSDLSPSNVTFCSLVLQLSEVWQNELKFTSTYGCRKCTLGIE